MTFDITILLFGPVRELAGSDRIRLNVRPQMTSAEIIQEIVHVSLQIFAFLKLSISKN